MDQLFEVEAARLRPGEDRLLDVEHQTYKDCRSAALAEWRSLMALGHAIKATVAPIGDELRSG